MNKEVTQTGIILILKFGLCEENEREALVNKLCELIDEFDGRMSTGFLGTPYILHALSENGRCDKAFDLLFQEKSPSWLFSVNQGATTIWEHWDSVREDGSFWSTDMNSFNHYAYGGVADWMYAVPGGIRLDHPGYDKLTLQPVADDRLRFFETCVDTVRGTVRTHWHWEGKELIFQFDVPVAATVVLPDGTHQVSAGQHEFRISQ